MSDMIVLQTMPRMMQASAKVVEEITKLILEIAAQHRDNELVQALLEYGKLGGNLDFEICRSFAISDYDEKLTQHGIPHAIVYDKVTQLGTIITRDIDREAVLKAKNELFVEQKRLTRLTPDEFYKLNAGKTIEIIRARSNTEAKVFQQQAKKEGLSNITFQKNPFEPDKLDIFYTSQDKALAQRVLCKTAIATTGLSGEYTALRISRELDFQRHVMRDVQQAEKDFYIVSKLNPNEYVHFNKDGLQYFKNGNIVRDEPRSSSRFVSVAKTYISSVVSPVFVKKEDFKISPEERNEMMKQISLKDDDSTIKSHSIDNERLAQQSIEIKLRQGPDKATDISSEFYSPEASFAKLFDESKLSDSDRIFIAKLDKLPAMDKALIKNYIGNEISSYASPLAAAMDSSKAFYVVSGSKAGEVLRFDRGGVDHFKNGSFITTTPRSSPDFAKIVSEKLSGLSNPVTLSKEEYNLPQQELHKILERHKPALDMQTRQAQNLERMARQLVEAKLAIENVEQIQIPSSFYNPNVSFGKFVDVEKDNSSELKDLVKTMDQLEDKEKILVKSFIKDTFDKVQSVEVQSAYVDPASRIDDFDSPPVSHPDQAPDIDIPPEELDAHFSYDMYELRDDE